VSLCGIFILNVCSAIEYILLLLEALFQIITLIGYNDDNNSNNNPDNIDNNASIQTRITKQKSREKVIVRLLQAKIQKTGRKD
jgi:hypothetical protein